MFISAIIKYTCAWNMVNMQDDLSNTSRSTKVYFRKKETESTVYIQHIHTKRKINTLTTLKKNQVFLHPKDADYVIQYRSNSSTRHEIDKMFSSFFLADNDTDIF